ncbi:acyl-CoA dehydrogenase family protein [Rhodococcoides yunnanense]|uniref:acyl-CoA dehydrogenase family protein n=1 Tax=Rhodococcoides yunnanense TaxID=278209 RepID=UPI000933435B|nr:acyl-CoA dehydrogenase family protein [Rhodococcus yunnanensis]
MSTDLFPSTTDEQRMMLDVVSRVFDTISPLDVVRAASEKSEPSSPELRRTLADVGCFGLLVDEAHGGGGLSINSVVDAALVAAERGASLQPGPFVGSSITAHTLSRVGAAAHRVTLNSLISGAAAATWAPDGLTGGTAGAVVSVDSGHVVLGGVIEAVQDADECAVMLLSTPTDGGITQILVPLSDKRIELQRRGSLDITRRFFDVHLSDVLLPMDAVLADGAAGRALFERQLAVAAVLSAAESIGAMDTDFGLAVEYAKSRIAFGRPIGSFQAVKHLLANTGLMLEMAKSSTTAAAESVGNDSDDALAMASMARMFVSEKSIELAHNCFQVFGGIGYTWEHDHHLFMRRLASDAYLFGSPTWHSRTVWAQSHHASHENRSIDV